jgi:hypothetical protein
VGNLKTVSHGDLILWGNAFPTCATPNQTYGDRLRALYIVNGGKCSPVYSFTPNIKWNFTAAMAAGGLATPVVGKQQTAREQLKASSGPNCALFGEAPRYQGGVANTTADNHGAKAGIETLRSAAEHLRANFLHNSIEAELRIQGDPSDWLCSPIFGYGSTVAIMVINPFFLKNPPEDNPNDCTQWGNTLDESDDEEGSKCNEILSNRNWFIQGVDHQIKDGSYITTIKVVLHNPGSDFGGATLKTGSAMLFGEEPQDEPVMLGADPGSKNFFLCQQGTWTCVDRIAAGGEDVVAGMNTFCKLTCDSDTVVN